MINYIGYIIAIASAAIVGLILRLPLLPEKPMRQSWTISVIFPTVIIALGITAIISKLGSVLIGYQQYYVSLTIGVLTAIFAKFMLERILPRPPQEEST